ncbi:MAG: kelch repeat-containing protein [Bacteroidales bacterium]
MEKNKRSLLGQIFGGKKDVDVTAAGKKCIPCGALNAPDAKFCLACGSAFPVIYDSYDAFISYRRETASDLASLLKVQLENSFHKRIFIDIKELQEGRFDEALLNRIEETPNFILILSKSSLDRCKEKSDWLKREIVHAIDTRRNIIPVLMKGFSFPSDDLWELLPKKMRLLSSLNGINYDHIHQDSDIRRIASYMKTEKEIPPLKLAPEPDEPEPLPPSGDGATKPGPVQSGSATLGQPYTGQSKPLQVPSSGHAVPPDQSNVPYFPVTGLMVVDSEGSETILTEFGVRHDSGRNWETSLRDVLTITVGQGLRPIPWGQIESIEIKNRDDATVKLCDGTIYEHIKLHPTRLVGTNQEGFSFVFDFSNKLTICTLSDPAHPGQDELMRNIPILVKRTIPSATKWTLTVQPEGKGVSITAHNYYYDELKNTLTFTLPGPHKFSVNGNLVKFSVSQTPGKNFTIGPFPIETAAALAMALNRLNLLLSQENDMTEKKETPEGVNQESLVFLKRGEFLTVGVRESKTRSFYYGPGTVLQVKEMGKGNVYPWYRFQGADGNDYWFEGPGPIDTVDRRCFFRVSETGQMGYLAEILGERDEPWGSVEVFKFDDDMAGPTEVRFDQIISMTSINGAITIKKESGNVSGSLQKLVNYKSGFTPKGPCLITSDAVIPLVRTNRESSITISRISDSEKPPLIPVSIFSSKTQLKFLFQANSAVGYFDDTIPDIYVQFNEQSLGWMRIYIPSIVRLVVNPDCKESPVTIETTEGRTYKGICHDPFNYSGSVISFVNAKKPMVFEAAGRGSGKTVPDASSGSINVSGEAIDKEEVWTMRTTNGPGQRSDFGMVYDDKRELIILHGGFGPGNVSHNQLLQGLSAMRPEQNDTWVWDGSSWRFLSNCQQSLVSHGMAYDKKTGQDVILGGWTGSQRIKSTYVLIHDNWIQADAGNVFEVGGFQNHAMGYDEKRKTVILFGGLTIKVPGGQIALGDTWEWNGSGWSQLHVEGPDPRWGHKMVFDYNMGAIVLFGGNNGKTILDDTWIWEGSSASWRKMSPEIHPSARSNYGMVYDSMRGRDLMFGGLSADKLPLNDLWEWDGKEWILIMEQAPPKPRYNHGFAYDTKRHKSVLYGGTDGKEFFRDTWEFGT